MAEDIVISPVLMDRSNPIANSPDPNDSSTPKRRRLHVKISQDSLTESIPVDTELPVATQLQVGMDPPIAPDVKAWLVGFNAQTGLYDPATLATLFDMDQNPGIEAVLGISARTPGAGGSIEIGVDAQPWSMQGNIPDNGSDLGNPLKIGGVGKSNLVTKGSDGVRKNALYDLEGRQCVSPFGPREYFVQQPTTITNSTAETTILTAVASVFLDLTCLVITNQTAIAVTVTIKDATGGTTRMIIDLPASGQFILPATAPIFQSAVNNNWTATLSLNTNVVNFFVQAVKKQ